MHEQFELPRTTEHPDHVDFDTGVIAWDFEVREHPARRVFVQPDFEVTLRAAEPGERIVFIRPARRASMTISELGEEGEVKRSRLLSEQDDHIDVPGGGDMRLKTAGRIVEYVSIHSDESKPVKQPDNDPAGPTEEDQAALNQMLGEAFYGRPAPMRKPKQRGQGGKRRARR